MENTASSDFEPRFASKPGPAQAPCELIEFKVANADRESLNENFSADLDRWTQQMLSADGLKLNTSGLLAADRFYQNNRQLRVATNREETRL